MSTSATLLRSIRATLKQRGITYRQGYLFVVSPSAELTVTPDISTKQNPFLNLEWRDDKLTSLELHPTTTGAIRIITPHGQTIATISAASAKSQLSAQDNILQLRAHEVYRITFQ